MFPFAGSAPYTPGSVDNKSNGMTTVTASGEGEGGGEVAIVGCKRSIDFVIVNM